MALRSVLTIASLSIAILCTRPVHAAIVSSGSVEFVFNNNSFLFSGAGGPLIMDRFYGTDVDTATATQIAAAIGGDPITVPGSGQVTLGASLNGPTVTQPDGRARQTTNLDVDFNSVLATWGIGEQIGIDAVLRSNVDPGFGGGFLAIGDYSLVNQSGTLTLLNNLSFTADAFTIGSPTFTDLGNGFSVHGDLLVSTSLSDLTGGLIPTGTNIGSFTLNAITAVPEPSSLALLAIGSVGISLIRRRRKNGESTSASMHIA